MNELKTLKDLPSIDLSDEIEYERDRYIPESLLKAEAVKWYHRSDGNKHKFIRDFFNLTEEDVLK